MATDLQVDVRQAQKDLLDVAHENSGLLNDFQELDSRVGRLRLQTNDLDGRVAATDHVVHQLHT